MYFHSMIAVEFCVCLLSSVPPYHSLMTSLFPNQQINVWENYLKKETDLAVLQGEVDIVKRGIVIAIKRNGKVLRRGVGIPPWKTLADDLQEKISVPK